MVKLAILGLSIIVITGCGNHSITTDGQSRAVPQKKLRSTDICKTDPNRPECRSVEPSLNIVSLSSPFSATASIPIVFSFSESVTDFTVEDVKVTNGHIENFTGNGSHYAAKLVASVEGYTAVAVAKGAAKGAGGLSSQSADFTILYDGTNPTVVTPTLLASGIAAGSLTLSWTAATDPGTPSDELLYEIRVSTSNNMATVAAAETNGTVISPFSAGIVTQQIKNLNSLSSYFFTVLVKDRAGLKSIYSTVNAVTIADTTPPTAGTTIAAENLTGTSFSLVWTAASDDATSAADLKYLVCKGASTAALDTIAECEGATVLLPYTAGLLSLNEGQLTPGGTYYYNVVVQDRVGNKAIYPGFTHISPTDITPPVPASLQAVDSIGISSVRLNWSWATDALSPQSSLRYYVCYAATAAEVDTLTECATATRGMDWTLANTSAEITGLTSGTTYFFNVMVKDQYENRALYEGTSAKTLTGVSSALRQANDATYRHAFFDDVNQRHWQFYYDGSAIFYRYSADQLSWTSAGSVSATVGNFTVHMATAGGTAYVFLASEENSIDIVLRRGTLTANSLTFESPITVYDGSSFTDRYGSPAVVTDATNVWVAGARFSGNAITTSVVQSTNAFTGNLTVWDSPSTLGLNSVTPRTHALLATGGETIALVYLDGEMLYTYKFDGSAWAAANNGGPAGWSTSYGNSYVGNGFDRIVVDATGIYVSGSFTDLGGMPAADYIAHFDGQSWRPLGEGLSGTVTEIYMFNGILYALGSFTDAGGDPDADKLAKWDGQRWSSVGSFAKDFITCLTSDGIDLYIGGYFVDLAGLQKADGIVRWDGKKIYAVGNGLPVSSSTIKVSVLQFVGSTLYAGGGFVDVGGDVNADYLAKWNGSAWVGVGTTPLNGGVTTLASDGTNLYVGGTFTDVGGNANADRIAMWNGSAWSALGSGLSGATSVMKWLGGALYVSYSYVGGSGYFSKWDGTAWSVAAPGFPGNGPTDMVKFGANIYVTFRFSNLNGVASATSLAFWNGSVWEGLGNTSTSQTFFSTKSVQINNDTYFIDSTVVYKWNGSNLTVLGGVFSSTVNQLKSIGGVLYASGSFVNAGGDPNADYIAKWDGSAWSAVVSGITNGSIQAFDISGSNVVVAGTFTDAGGNTAADSIALWNGSAWQALPTIASGTVNSLAFYGGSIYAGGSFANYFQKWNGTSWEILGTGVNGSVNDLKIFDSKLIVAGGFSSAGGLTKTHMIAAWNGSIWSSLLPNNLEGSDIKKLIVEGANLYMVGTFTDPLSTDKAENVAVWDGNQLRGFTTSGRTRPINLDFAASATRKVSFVSYGQIETYTDATAEGVSAFSAVTNDLRDPVVLYTKYRRPGVYVRTYSAGSWSAESQIFSNYSTSPVLASVSGTAGLMALWFNGTAINYKTFDGNSWASSTNAFVPAFVKGHYLNCNELTVAGSLTCLVAGGLRNPFDVSAWSTSP